MQFGATRNQLLERSWILGIVLGLHFNVRECGSVFNNGFVLGCQRIKRLLIDEEIKLRASFPPTGVVVVRRDLVEAELLVIVRANPFGRINRAFFQRLINLAARNILRDHTHALADATSKAADAEFEAFDVSKRLDFLPVPAAHLRAGIAARKVHDAVLHVELTHQFQAVALVHPGRHLAAIQAEGNGATQCKAVVLAEEVIRRGVTRLDRAVLHRVDKAGRRNNLTGCMHGNLKFSARHFADL